ncbi:biotin/lipoyl-binding protein [Cyanothece sp. BG0011]|uniref:biotin/lipoyl-binding protein n=1 Tax=Cyanothece sp. BG0011 TaxID=2082950 RepID=UPI000D1EFA1E|nr:biotin/lipoyl-binding protein [Cyanothece sp. BG0011]
MTNAANNGHLSYPSHETAFTQDELISKSEESQTKTTTDHADDWANSTKEILDTLPRVWTRGLLYFLVIFVGVALPWAMLAKVDETGTATGKLEPQGKTIKLDAPVEGKVSFIKIKEGDKVKAGERLMEIESDLVKADLKQQQTKLEGQEQRLNQLKILANQLQLVFQTQQQQNQAQKLEKLAQINQAKANLEMLRNSYHLQREEKQAKVSQAQQDLEHSQKAIQLAEVQLQNAQNIKDRL